MMRISRVAAGLLVAGLAGLVSSAAPAAEEPGGGHLAGTVTSAAGAPPVATLVSASGPQGTAVATCDAAGRFEFNDLQPGRYLLRAHASGFATAGRHLVEISAGLSTLHSLRLRRVQPAGPEQTGDAQPAVLAAGVTPGLLWPAADLGALGAEQPEGAEPDPPQRGEPQASAAPHPHTEKAWRLRRARRSVLKDASGVAAAAGGGAAEWAPGKGEALGGRPARHLLDGFALSGQFQLLARTQIDPHGEFGSADQLPGQVAYVDVGAPEDELGWGLRGAVTMGDSGSWVLAGSYLTELTSDHELALGASYSKQRPPPEDLDAATPAPGGAGGDRYANRQVGRVRAEGSWTLSRRVTLGYGAVLAHYGYLEQGRLFSPRAEVVVEPAARTRVRATLARNLSAPGAEEFHQSATGFWLPPERTFAPLSALEPLQAQRTRHVELAVERDLGPASAVGVRRFRQDVANQTITLFGMDAGGAGSGADHYYLANARGLDAAGWGVSFHHTLAGRVRGTVEYSVTRSHWEPWGGAGLSRQAALVAARGVGERFHDVTTSVETEIPETATSVFVLARVNTAFSRATAAAAVPAPGVRFAFRVRQTLPFAPFGDSDWEVLVDVRNLLREQTAGASVHDELLVVNPPTQFVGGLVVHF